MVDKFERLGHELVEFRPLLAVVQDGVATGGLPEEGRVVVGVTLLGGRRRTERLQSIAGVG